MTIETVVNKLLPCFQFIRAYNAMYRVCDVGWQANVRLQDLTISRDPFWEKVRAKLNRP
jgi:hypothetical protein